MAIASGHYLATGKPAVVYLQNSGLGNLVNPATSLTHSGVYSIPALLLIGWRGEPGVKDEPQHQVMGDITPRILETMDIPHTVIGGSQEEAFAAIETARRHFEDNESPFAILVRKGAFAEWNTSDSPSHWPEAPFREKVVEAVLDATGPSDVIVSTTGMCSREVFEVRERRNAGHAADFLTVGSMGHASQIALGIALARPDRRVLVLDGDGSLLMHMGGMAIIGQTQPNNLIHVCLNNCAHDSVGGQPTAASVTHLHRVAQDCGYRSSILLKPYREIGPALAGIVEGPAFIEISVAKGARKDLGRPTTTPQENKHALMDFLRLR